MLRALMFSAALTVAGLLSPGTGAAQVLVARGEWREFASLPSEHLRAVVPDWPACCVTMADGPEDIILHWSGGAWDTERKRLIVWGGGHGGYAGNEVYAFDLATLTWRRLTDPSNPTLPSSTDFGGTYDCRGGQQDWINPDGTPLSAETYGGLEYIPPPIDRLVAVSGAVWPCGDPSPTTFWLDPGTGTWVRKGDNPERFLGIASSYDPTTNTMLVQSANNLWRYDPRADLWELIATRPIDEDWFNVVYDPVRRWVLLIGNPSWWQLPPGPGQVIVYDLNEMEPVARVVTTTGPQAIVDAYVPGLSYHPPSGRIIGWNGGQDVYSLDLATATWTVMPRLGTVIPTDAANVGGAPRGTWGRFRWIPSEDLFVVVNSIDEPVYMYRLP